MRQRPLTFTNFCFLVIAASFCIADTSDRQMGQRTGINHSPNPTLSTKSLWVMTSDVKRAVSLCAMLLAQAVQHPWGLPPFQDSCRILKSKAAQSSLSIHCLQNTHGSLIFSKEVPVCAQRPATLHGRAIARLETVFVLYLSSKFWQCMQTVHGASTVTVYGGCCC